MGPCDEHRLGSSGSPFELNWDDVVMMGYAKMLVRPGKTFTLFKRLDDCCMKAALKCFGVENINIHQSMRVARSLSARGV